VSFTNELSVALAIASGTLPSPTLWYNADYVSLRISGTGVVYRQSRKEFAFRDPAIWLSAEMQRRAIGVPVIVEHPPTSILTSRYFGGRCVGMIVHSFVRNAELWGVARIIDANACELIAAGLFDTSPSVQFPPASSGGTGARTAGGILVEASPALLDHVALVYTGEGNKGVWTRSDGGNGPGVEVTESE
jgi:hypothetical protein